MTQVQTPMRKICVIWNPAERALVHAEYLRLLALDSGYHGRAAATKQCQDVLSADRRKTQGAVYAIRDWMDSNPVEVVQTSPAATPVEVGPLAVTPVSVTAVADLTVKDMALIAEERASLSGKMPSLEEYLATYIKTEIENILSPVRKASETLEAELRSRVVNLQTQPRKINFFPMSVEGIHQDAASSELPNLPQAGKVVQVTAHPLIHTVGIVGLLDREASDIKKTLSSKLYVRFIKNENTKRAVDSVQNMEHILVWQKHCSHAMTKALDNRGLKSKVVLVNSLTDIRKNLARITELTK